MTRIRYALIAPLVLAATALAQPPDPPPGDQPPPPGERPGRRPREGREGRGFGRFGPPMDAKAQLETMTKELTLDETQQAAIGKLLEEHQTKMEALREKMRPSPEQMEKFRAQREEMQAAREAGDEQKINELREKMRADRESVTGPFAEARKAREEAEKALHDGVVTQLRDDQKAKFETYWQERAQRGPGGMRGPMRSPTALKSIVDKLDDLTAEQKASIEKLFTDFRDASRKAPEMDLPGERAQGNNLQRKLYDDVLAVLTPAQKETVQKQLQGGRRGRGGEGADGRDGPGRFRRGGDGEDRPERPRNRV